VPAHSPPREILSAFFQFPASSAETKERSNKSGSAPVEFFDHLKLSFIEPDAATLSTLIDFDMMMLALLQIAATFRTLVEVHRSLASGSLVVEARASFLHQLGVEPSEIFFFVLAWLLVDRHRPRLCTLRRRSIAPFPVPKYRPSSEQTEVRASL